MSIDKIGLEEINISEIVCLRHHVFYKKTASNLLERYPPQFAKSRILGNSPLLVSEYCLKIVRLFFYIRDFT